MATVNKQKVLSDIKYIFGMFQQLFYLCFFSYDQKVGLMAREEMICSLKSFVAIFSNVTAKCSPHAMRSSKLDIKSQIFSVFLIQYLYFS